MHEQQRCLGLDLRWPRRDNASPGRLATGHTSASRFVSWARYWPSATLEGARNPLSALQSLGPVLSLSTGSVVTRLGAAARHRLPRIVRVRSQMSGVKKSATFHEYCHPKRLRGDRPWPSSISFRPPGDLFNFTAVEAMASGRPAIVSTGASELIEDGKNDYLFAAGDPKSLAGALERVLSESPTRLAMIGQKAWKTVRGVLDPQTIATQRIAAYAALIDAFRSQPPLPARVWLGDICRSTEPLQTNEMAFLDHLPWRAIAAYMPSRSRDKLATRVSRWGYSR